MTIDEILQKLERGNQRFVSDKSDRKSQVGCKKHETVKGQKPYAIILSCSDSRVIPELIFDTGLCELFVVRIAGNVASNSAIASIEYAVSILGSKVIMVLGHESCGAVSAAIKGGDHGKNLNQLLAHIAPALKALPQNANVNDVVKKNAELSAKELLNSSFIITKAVENKSIKIVTAFYHLSSGKVDFMDL
ncbi:MAG: carbonic anhydrase [Bacteroidota bacterium]|nr:carbonic anhydrase [Bacteroidota bacterium]